MEIYPGETIDKFIEEQITRWQSNRKRKYEEPIQPVITMSRLPGCGALNIAKQISTDLGIDFFDQKIIDEIAKDADLSRRVVETVDEQENSIVLEWQCNLAEERRNWQSEHHIYPYEYINRLINIIQTIGIHGPAVILGRGANYILPKEICLRVLVVSPLEIRINNVRDTYGVSEKVARQNIMDKESDRMTFIKRCFHADMLNPINYDLVFNMGMCGKDMVVEMIKSAYNLKECYK